MESSYESISSSSNDSQESMQLSDSFDSLSSGDFDTIDKHEKHLAQKPRTKRKEKRVGIVDDERCEYHVQTPDHQESPARVKVIREKLKSTGIYSKLVKINAIEPPREDL